MSNELVYKIALSKIPKVGAKLGKQLIAYCGGIKEVFDERKRNLLRIPGIGPQLAQEISQADPIELGEKDLNYHTKHNNKITFCLDDDYPKRLRHFDDAPLLLYSNGDFNPNPNRTVAVVGTRQPTPYGQQLCEELVNSLVPYKIQIISGLAYGIDALAHRTACDNELHNIAIMGTGMDVIYPAAHRNLTRKIKNKGALISEYPICMRADKENFPRRNRIIAAMADVIVVIQSARRGGSLITAEFGNQYFKDVFAYPGRIGDEASAGCNALIKQNKAHLIESVEDIAYIMRWEIEDTKSSNHAPTLFVELDKNEQKIMDLLKQEEEPSIDWLHCYSKKSLSELSSILLNLEFKGLIKALPGKKYCVLNYAKVI